MRTNKAGLGFSYCCFFNEQPVFSPWDSLCCGWFGVGIFGFACCVLLGFFYLPGGSKGKVL